MNEREVLDLFPRKCKRVSKKAIGGEMGGLNKKKMYKITPMRVAQNEDDLKRVL